MNNNKVDYNLLKTFYNVIQTESFTKAAALLNQPKSRVSRGISRLENQLGVELIRRTTRRTSATSIGRDFYQSISPILKNLNNEQSEQIIKMLETLEEEDDVQNIFVNCKIKI